MALNRVVLVGRLTRDPELKYTPAGVPIATMGIAVDRFTKDESGNYEVDFFNVTAWRRTAEFAQNYLKKRPSRLCGRTPSDPLLGRPGDGNETLCGRHRGGQPRSGRASACGRRVCARWRTRRRRTGPDGGAAACSRNGGGKRAHPTVCTDCHTTTRSDSGRRRCRRIRSLRR